MPSISIQDNQMSGAENIISTDGMSVKGVIRYGSPEFTYDTLFAYYNGITLAEVEVPYSITTATTAVDSHAASLIKAHDNLISLAALNWHCYYGYRTQAVNFVRATDSFSCYSNEASATFLKFDNAALDATGAALVTPPGTFIRSMALHLNRLFIIDTANMLWWCQLLDPTTWYASGTTEEYVYEDAGFAKIAGTDQIRQLVSFREALYLFGDESIWVLSGGEPDQFQLQRIVSGVGCGITSNLCVKDNVMYFIDDNVVYEFNGRDTPNIINFPVLSGDSSINGVTGGFNWLYPRYTPTDRCYILTDCAADDDFIYVFGRTVGPASGANQRMVCWVYLFDFRRRVWFRMAALPHVVVSVNAFFIVHHAVSRLGVLNWGVAVYDYVASAAVYKSYDYSTSGLFTTTAVAYVPASPDLGYICKFITKAFSAYPSMNMSPSDVYIVCRANTTSMDVYFSEVAGGAVSSPLTTDVDLTGFTLMKSVVAQVTSGLYTIIRAQFPHSFTKMMSPFFRLAIVMNGVSIEIHRIEVRYRVKGVVR